MLQILIEAESGSHWKSTYDEQTLTWQYQRRVPVPFPYPYGFILNTRGDDGDALDCYVVTRDPIEAGAVVNGRPLGLLEQIEDGEIDHKILAIRDSSELVLDSALHDVLRDFVLAVFQHYPETNVEVGRILSADEASAFIDAHRT